MFFETNEKYHEGFTIEEYNGIYSIASVQQGKDGKLYPRWCTVELGKDKKQQKLPLAVRLGDKDMALQALEDMMIKIMGKEESPPF